MGLSLNPYTELLQNAGLIDDAYLTVKQADSIFLACRAGSRARGIKTGNDKALSRPLFLEAVVSRFTILCGGKLKILSIFSISYLKAFQLSASERFLD